MVAARIGKRWGGEQKGQVFIIPVACVCILFRLCRTLPFAKRPKIRLLQDRIRPVAFFGLLPIPWQRCIYFEMPVTGDRNASFAPTWQSWVGERVPPALLTSPLKSLGLSCAPWREGMVWFICFIILRICLVF